jgi:hypothetical protein
MPALPPRDADEERHARARALLGGLLEARARLFEAILLVVHDAEVVRERRHDAHEVLGARELARALVERARLEEAPRLHALDAEAHEHVRLTAPVAQRLRQRERTAERAERVLGLAPAPRDHTELLVGVDLLPRVAARVRRLEHGDRDVPRELEPRPPHERVEPDAAAHRQERWIAQELGLLHDRGGPRDRAFHVALGLAVVERQLRVDLELTRDGIAA